MTSAMRSIVWACALLASVTISAVADEPAPSRPPIDKCVWEKMADKTIGLAAWAQRCDFGFRQIHFEFVATRSPLNTAMAVRPIRWSFVDFGPDSCVWRGEALGDDGKTWKLESEFRLRRIRADAGGRRP